MSNAKITVAKSVDYTGAAVTPEVVVKAGAKAEVIVKDGDKVLVAGKDYKLAYSKNTAVGKKATVTIVGVGDYLFF